MKNPSGLEEQAQRVMIILGPDLIQAWTRAGKLEPITSSPISRFLGRMIGVTLSFPNFSNRPSDTYHRRAKGSIELFLCSVYHPCDAEEQKDFYDKLDNFIAQRPRDSELLIGGRRQPHRGDEITEVLQNIGSVQIK